MTLEKVCEIGKECGLSTLEEALNNVMFHYPFEESKCEEELRELTADLVQLLLDRLGNTQICNLYDDNQKVNKMAHVHCIICGTPLEISEEDEKHYSTIKYVCADCVDTFSSEYILHRLECARNGINKDSFDRLEWRLTFGKDKPYRKPNSASVYLYE